MTVKEKKIPKHHIDEEAVDIKKLILFNDDVNTFDFVIETLIDVCGHDALQAENCAWIAHFKGKCAVKKGSFEELEPCYREMTRRKLIVQIQ